MPRGSTGDVRVTVGADVSDLRRGMNQAGGMVKEFAQSAERSRGQVRVLADALTNLTGMSGTAGRAVGAFGSVLAGLASGGVAGAAFAGVSAIVQAFKEMGEKAPDAAQKTKDALEGIKKAAVDARVEHEKLQYVAAGGDARMFDAIHKLAGGEQYYQELLGKRDRIIAQVNQRNAELRRHWEEQKRAEAGITDRLAYRGEQAMEEMRAINEKIKQIEEERRAIIGLAAAQIDADQAKARAEREAADSRKEDKAAAEDERQRMQEIDEYLESYERGQRETEAALTQLRIRQAEEDDERRAEQAKKDKQLADQQIASQMQIGAQLGTVMGQLVTGQKTFAQVMASVAQMVIQQVVKMAITRVTAHAAEAGAGAASSQASIPYVGPVLAIAAMTAMVAAVTGLIGGIGGAAEGAYLPSFSGGRLGVLHADEMVTTKGDTAIWKEIKRQIVGGRGGGGTTINNYVSTVDARGYERMLDRNQGAQRRVARRQARLGRS